MRRRRRHGERALLMRFPEVQGVVGEQPSRADGSAAKAHAVDWARSWLLLVVTSVPTDSVQDDFTSTAGPDAAAQDKEKAGSCRRLFAAARLSAPGACNRRQPLPRHLQIFPRSMLPVRCGAFYHSSYQEDAAATTGRLAAAPAEDRKAGCLALFASSPHSTLQLHAVQS